MKKVFKIVLWFAGISLILLLLAVGSFAFYLETSADDMESEETWKRVIDSINISPELPPLFYEVYENMHPGVFEAGSWGDFCNTITGKTTTPLPSRLVVYYTQLGTGTEKFRRPIVTLEIEDNCSQKKCFDYEMNHVEYGINIIGVQKAAQQYFKKSLPQLNEREVASLLIMMRNPPLFNPDKRPDKIKAAVDRYFQNKKK